MSLYSELINLKQEVIGIREELGDPRLRQLVFEYPNESSQYFVVTPKLVVSQVPDRMIGLPLDSRSNIMISAEDLYIKNVSRNVPKEALRTRAWLDPVYDSGGIITSGLNCRAHVINDKGGLSYTLILRKEYDTRS
jgi:hypothetical protein